jgi:hypothetical protein
VIVVLVNLVVIIIVSNRQVSAGWTPEPAGK